MSLYFPPLSTAPQEDKKSPYRDNGPLPRARSRSSSSFLRENDSDNDTAAAGLLLNGSVHRVEPQAGLCVAFERAVAQVPGPPGHFAETLLLTW
ncbi:hypothetical protein PpBr36_04545 [Pyricularia pennisetigena]|uniref:hypothetical protein n=1 Tax=Pyricularia pennisetigena TaxID=1578925 RepID=UPI00114DFC33|nr:hypothetical protein PpBr36_04545 [Pyricularia pennisetigena]TLS26283.1 hypothetical protein PpBr36_04545 [Pyricularia pennisetigena]